MSYYTNDGDFAYDDYHGIFFKKEAIKTIMDPLNYSGSGQTVAREALLIKYTPPLTLEEKIENYNRKGQLL